MGCEKVKCGISCLCWRKTLLALEIFSVPCYSGTSLLGIIAAGFLVTQGSGRDWRKWRCGGWWGRTWWHTVTYKCSHTGDGCRLLTCPTFVSKLFTYSCCEQYSLKPIIEVSNDKLWKFIVFQDRFNENKATGQSASGVGQKQRILEDCPMCSLSLWVWLKSVCQLCLFTCQDSLLKEGGKISIKKTSRSWVG